MRKTKNLDVARIPVERAITPILLQAGIKDALWPTEQMSKRLITRVTAENPGHEVEIKTYALDHYLSRDANVRADAIDFLNTQFAKTCVSTK